MTHVRSIFEIVLQSFKGNTIFLHIGAWSVTAVCVLSGFDWWYYTVTRSEALWNILIPAGPIGFIIPLVVPVLLWALGKYRCDEKVQAVAFALAYAQIAAWLISSGYKGLTGRAHPPLGPLYVGPDISAVFNFGFLREGIFWGWPSSHTAVAFAGATALSSLFPRFRTISYIYATYIGLGAGTCFHWISDALAGALIGTAAGKTATQISDTQPH